MEESGLEEFHCSWDRLSDCPRKLKYTKNPNLETDKHELFIDVIQGLKLQVEELISMYGSALCSKEILYSLSFTSLSNGTKH